MDQLPDIQQTRDTRNLAIDKVGVRNVKFPIVVLDRSNEKQHTAGKFTMTVDLPAEFKGTHMSRFLEALNSCGREVSVHSLPNLLSHMADRLQARSAHVEVRFPFFMMKKAPVTGAEGMMEYDLGFDAVWDGAFSADLLLTVPVATLCPCSKEISARGAHNQRGWVNARVRHREHIWLEEVIEMIEDSSSCPLFPVLKRPDEKWVTERAYDNPRFVEDVVREVARRFDADSRIGAFTVEVENEESIHAHNAYARIERA